MPANPPLRDPVRPSSRSLSPRNLTLAGLPRTILDALAPHLAPVDLPQGTSLVKPDRTIHWIYFLESGMASMNSMDLGGTPVEVGIIGREGLVGVQALLGQTQTQNAVTMQAAGNGFRIRVDTLREHMTSSIELTRCIHTFVYAMLEQTTQLVLCNRLHELEPRLARWLLMTFDVTQDHTLRLTQEYLAEMLGVGRPAVTIAAGALQRAGSIAYSRGVVEIINREQLQGTSCQCYTIIRNAYLRVYPEIFSRQC